MLYNCYKNCRVQRPYRAVTVAVVSGLSTEVKVVIGVGVGVGATGAATAIITSGSAAANSW